MKLSPWMGASASPLQQWVERFFADDEAFLRQWKKEDISLPAVNVRETPQAWEVEVAAPGFGKDDLKITAESGLLTIRAERKTDQESKDEERKFIRKEFSYSRFERQFSLPEDVREEEVKATFENGILRLHLPRQANGTRKETRQIPIGS